MSSLGFNKEDYKIIDNESDNSFEDSEETSDLADFYEEEEKRDKFIEMCGRTLTLLQDHAEAQMCELLDNCLIENFVDFIRMHVE